MSGRTARPIVEVIGPQGGDVVTRYGPAIAGIQITDQAGLESDECEIRIRVTPPFPKAPAPKTAYSVRARWSDGMGGEYEGRFSVQRVSWSGSAEDGYEMVVVCRAAAAEALSKAGTEHFDDKTVEEIVKKVAGKAGLSVTVDKKIGATKIAYRLRHEQSAIDFITDLCTPLGGLVKVTNDRLIVMARGEGTSAGGGAMGEIVVRLGEELEIDLDIEQRGAVAEARTNRHDRKTGRVVVDKDEGSKGAGRSSTLHPSPSEDEAKATAKARRREEQRRTCDGGITVRGRPSAQQGMRVRLVGYGPDLDEADLVARQVVHAFDPASAGWTTEISVEKRTAEV